MSDDTQRVIGQLQAEIRQLREALREAQDREAELARKMADLEALLNQVMGAVKMLRWLGAAVAAVVSGAGYVAGRLF